MITGSCHCQAVKYQINGKLAHARHCHCNTCRKIHGTVYASSAVVGRPAFSLVTGIDKISEYESSPGKRRCFCSNCGAHIYAYLDAKPHVIMVRLGTIDGDPGIRPERHIWVSHKAPWYEINDNLPQEMQM